MHPLISLHIVQKNIKPKYTGNAYSIDPYSGDEDLFLVELGLSQFEDKNGSEILSHSYSVNYHDCSITCSEVGTGYVNFTEEMVKTFSKILLDVQNILKMPQKIRFFIDTNEKIWISSSKTVVPILFNKDSGKFFGLDILDPNVGFEVYSPMMFSMIKSSIDVALENQFSNFQREGESIVHRFGRPYLRFESISSLLLKLPTSGLSYLHKALDLSDRLVTDDQLPNKSFPLFSKVVARFNLERKFRNVLKQFEELENESYIITTKCSLLTIRQFICVYIGNMNFTPRIMV